MENPHLRAAVAMPKALTGVMINTVQPTAPAAQASYFRANFVYVAYIFLDFSRVALAGVRINTVQPTAPAAQVCRRCT